MVDKVAKHEVRGSHLHYILNNTRANVPLITDR